ncbi:MAG: pilus assembly protein [Actinobacteria bacterium]|nr:pilus assembly protein [Actinomycetota bacterium]
MPVLAHTQRSAEGTEALRARGEAGSATASFVVLFPVLVVMFMALVQWGLYFHAQSLVDAAAQDASRVTQDADGTVEDGRAVAADLLVEATGTGLLEGLVVDVGDQNGVVRAVVRGQVRSLVPLPGFDLEVVGVSGGPKERFLAEDER